MTPTPHAAILEEGDYLKAILPSGRMIEGRIDGIEVDVPPGKDNGRRVDTLELDKGLGLPISEPCFHIPDDVMFDVTLSSGAMHWCTSEQVTDWEHYDGR